MKSGKTNGKVFLYLLLILAVLLAWYPTLQDWFTGPSAVSQPVVIAKDKPSPEPPEPIDSAFTANPNSKTWRVYEGDGHLELDDSFKILKTKGEYWLRPSFVLRYKWAKLNEPGFSFKLTKMKITTEAGKQESILCGMVELETPEHKVPEVTHVKHAVMVFPGKHEDLLTVHFYSNPSDDDCETVWEKRDNIMDHHGGVIHIEN